MSNYNTGSGTSFTTMPDIKIYDNEVLQVKVESALNTALDLQKLATVDTSLTAAPGMQISVRTYTPSGEAERLAMGQKNTTYVGSDYVEADYRVNTLQATGKYYDEQVMADPKAIDVAIGQLPTAITNSLNKEVVTEFAKGTQTSAWSVDVASVLEALTQFPDDEVINASDKFIVVNNADYVKLIKDAMKNSMYVKDNTDTNSLGSVAGVKIYVSKLVPADTAYLATREAVTIFTKKGFGVETDRDIEERCVTMVANTVNVVALTDAKKLVVLSKAEA
jgi:hypothetical protein